MLRISDFIKNNEFELLFFIQTFYKIPISFEFLSVYFVVLGNLMSYLDMISYDFGKPVIKVSKSLAQINNTRELLLQELQQMNFHQINMICFRL